MSRITQIAILVVALLPRPGVADVNPTAVMGTMEFGMTESQLVRNVERVETLIAQCMRKQGFEYVPVDYNTIRSGMEIVETMPGMSEEKFVSQFGFGISTLYVGIPPQLSTGYNPARTGLGEQNVRIFQSLSSTDQAAYTRALFGDNPEATFAVSLEEENFSRCGGCTRQALEQVFTEEQLASTYYNPMDAMVSQDPRMKKALRKFSEEMRKRGFDYAHPDDVKPDLLERLDAITDNRSIPVDQLTPDQQEALRDLQEYERKVARVAFKLAEDIFDPVEERIQREMFSRDVK
jgi:hypothetical protein